MITFIEALNSKMPPPPSSPGGPGPPGLPTLPIDNGLIFLFFTAIVLGTYMYCKQNTKQRKTINKTSSLTRILKGYTRLIINI